MLFFRVPLYLFILFYFPSFAATHRTSRNPVAYDRPKKYTPRALFPTTRLEKKNKTKQKNPDMPRGYCDSRRRMRLYVRPFWHFLHIHIRRFSFVKSWMLRRRDRSMDIIIIVVITTNAYV